MTLKGARATKKLVMSIIVTVGPIGVLLIGGLLVAIAALVFVQRVRRPPAYVTLVRAS